jgi:hypothetical protein
VGEVQFVEAGVTFDTILAYTGHVGEMCQPETGIILKKRRSVLRIVNPFGRAVGKTAEVAAVGLGTGSGTWEVMAFGLNGALGNNPDLSREHEKGTARWHRQKEVIPSRNNPCRGRERMSHVFVRIPS